MITIQQHFFCFLLWHQKKEPPRYPTPQSNVRLNNVARKPHPSVKPPSPPSGRDAPSHSSYSTPTNGIRDEDLVNIEKIQKYQEELRARKEQEDAFRREQEFLRNSLQESASKPHRHRPASSTPTTKSTKKTWRLAATVFRKRPHFPFANAYPLIA